MFNNSCKKVGKIDSYPYKVELCEQDNKASTCWVLKELSRLRQPSQHTITMYESCWPNDGVIMPHWSRFWGLESGTDQSIVSWQQSLTYWIKISQHTLFGDKNFNSWRSQLFLILDEKGVMTCGGWLGNADIPQSTTWHCWSQENAMSC